jgi:hypothetical protein
VGWSNRRGLGNRTLSLKGTQAEMRLARRPGGPRLTWGPEGLHRRGSLLSVQTVT